jgi:hypothetical protein
MQPETAIPIVLSAAQAHELLQARQHAQASAATSLDLGLTTAAVALLPEGAAFPGGERLDWEQIAAIANDDVGCFMVEEGAAHKIQAFSEAFNRFYSLMPTSGAPTMLIGGFPMHRIKETDPYRDTLAKVRALGKARGHVLDTATGLGYTAIELARTAAHVTTIELDPTTLEIARCNPWSRGLFAHPAIEQRIGDAADVVQGLPDRSFARVLHDPPIFSLAGELYSGAFYQQLYRVLKPGGRLFHYIGSPESKSGGGVTRGVLRRLQQAGFRRVVRRAEAFGVVAFKE